MIDQENLILALEDTVIAASNAVTAAESLGIGSCFIGDIMKNYEKVSSLLHLLKYAMPLVRMVFDYPGESQLTVQNSTLFVFRYGIYKLLSC